MEIMELRWRQEQKNGEKNGEIKKSTKSSNVNVKTKSKKKTVTGGRAAKRKVAIKRTVEGSSKPKKIKRPQEKKPYYKNKKGSQYKKSVKQGSPLLQKNCLGFDEEKNSKSRLKASNPSKKALQQKSKRGH